MLFFTHGALFTSESEESDTSVGPASLFLTASSASRCLWFFICILRLASEPCDWSSGAVARLALLLTFSAFADPLAVVFAVAVVAVAAVLVAVAAVVLVLVLVLWPWPWLLLLLLPLGTLTVTATDCSDVLTELRISSLVFAFIFLLDLRVLSLALLSEPLAEALADEFRFDDLLELKKYFVLDLRTAALPPPLLALLLPLCCCCSCPELLVL